MSTVLGEQTMNTKSFKQRATLALAVVGSWLVYCQGGVAQVRRYQPSSPTVSPYLDLTRPNFGGVSNYYSLVRPQQQQRAFNLEEQALRRHQSQTLGRLQNDFLRTTTLPATGTGSWFLTPGTKASYLDTTQFFPQPALRGARR